MKFIEKIKGLFKPKCDHDWAVIWESDYKRYVLGEQVSPFLALNGARTVKWCQKCGAVEEHIFVPTEERAWADRFLVKHFEEGANEE